MDSYVIFDKRIKRYCNNEQIADGDLKNTDGLCIEKKFVFVYLQIRRKF